MKKQVVIKYLSEKGWRILIRNVEKPPYLYKWINRILSLVFWVSLIGSLVFPEYKFLDPLTIGSLFLQIGICLFYEVHDLLKN